MSAHEPKAGLMGFPEWFDDASHAAGYAQELGAARTRLELMERQRGYFEILGWIESEPAMAGAVKVRSNSFYSYDLEAQCVTLAVEFADGRVVKDIKDTTGLLVAFSSKGPKGAYERLEAMDGFLAGLREKLDEWLPEWRQEWHPEDRGLSVDPQGLRAALFTAEEIREWDRAVISRQSTEPGRLGAKLRV